VAERGRMRRQLRERRREREARLLDLGALVYELHRQGKRAPELLQEKAAELSVIDEQVRELEAALDGGGGAEVDEPGEQELDAPEHEGAEAEQTPDEPADSAQTEETDALELAEHGDEGAHEERPA
jgi:hypothetical protein